ncbi:MAG: Secretion system C-terminal sorting domain [Bacteroidota bacterium]|jgi:hypothetical protein
MKKLLFVYLVLSGFYSSAQTIAPSTINASGGATIINSNSYEWSIAEMVDVATYNTGSNFVTTGLLQPLEEKLSVHLLPNSNTSVSIYPNPFTSIINLNIKSDDIQDIQIIVKNMLGQLVYQQAYTLMSNNDVVQINLNQLSVGPYVIEVNNTNHNLLLTEKIIKND